MLTFTAMPVTEEDEDVFPVLFNDMVFSHHNPAKWMKADNFGPLFPVEADVDIDAPALFEASRKNATLYFECCETGTCREKHAHASFIRAARSKAKYQK